MPKLQYATTYLDRDRGNLSELPVINMYVEQFPAEENPILQSRPGLEATGTTMGSGPVKTLLKMDGILNNVMFGISGYTSLGAEQVLNGTFTSATTSWTANVATLSIVSNRLRVTNSTTNFGRAEQSVAVNIGQSYTFAYESIAGTASPQIYLGSTDGGIEYANIVGAANTSLTFTATTSTVYIRLYVSSSVSGQYADFDNISIKANQALALYSAGTLVGGITGTGPGYLSGYADRVFANAGGDVYSYDGTTLSKITMPDNALGVAICVGTSRLVVISASGRFYWSDALTSTIDALSFATAENSPDKLRDCLFLGDTLHLFGAETVEFWPASANNPDLPFQPLVGRTFQVGIRGTGCASPFAGSFAWITNHNQICVNDAQTVISNPSLDEKLAASSTASLWNFFMDGMEFLACRLDTSTWVFCKATSMWSQFASDGQTNWIPRCYNSGIFGSGLTGALCQWSSNHEDFGGTMERRFRAGLNITDGTVPLHQLTIRTPTGRTPYTVGSYTNPNIELRASKDGGETWSAWRARPMGTQAQYRRNIRWSSLGYFGNPGILIEIRVTAPVPFRVSDISVNEKYATI